MAPIPSPMLPPLPSPVGVSRTPALDRQGTLAPRGRDRAPDDDLLNDPRADLLVDAPFDRLKQEVELLRPRRRGAPHDERVVLEGLDR